MGRARTDHAATDAASEADPPPGRGLSVCETRETPVGRGLVPVKHVKHALARVLLEPERQNSSRTDPIRVETPKDGTPGLLHPVLFRVLSRVWGCAPSGYGVTRVDVREPSEQQNRTGVAGERQKAAPPA